MSNAVLAWLTFFSISSQRVKPTVILRLVHGNPLLEIVRISSARRAQNGIHHVICFTTTEHEFNLLRPGVKVVIIQLFDSNSNRC